MEVRRKEKKSCDGVWNVTTNNRCRTLRSIRAMGRKIDTQARYPTVKITESGLSSSKNGRQEPSSSICSVHSIAFQCSQLQVGSSGLQLIWRPAVPRKFPNAVSMVCAVSTMLEIFKQDIQAKNKIWAKTKDLCPQKVRKVSAYSTCNDVWCEQRNTQSESVNPCTKLLPRVSKEKELTVLPLLWNYDFQEPWRLCWPCGGNKRQQWHRQRQEWPR